MMDFSLRMLYLQSNLHVSTNGDQASDQERLLPMKPFAESLVLV
jgi:hypothetical protein